MFLEEVKEEKKTRKEKAQVYRDLQKGSKMSSTNSKYKGTQRRKFHPSINWVDDNIVSPPGWVGFSSDTQSVQSVGHAVLDEGLRDAFTVAVRGV